MRNRLILLTTFLLFISFFGCKKDEVSTTPLLLNSETTSFLESVYFTDINTGYAVGSNSKGTMKGIILKTINAGKTWTEIPFTVNNQFITILTSIYFTSSDIGYAVGWTGTIIKTVDAGNTWSPLSSGTMNDLHSIYFTSADIGYAVGNGGSMIKTADAGKTWTTVSYGTSHSYPNVTSIYLLNSNSGIAVGGSGVMLKTIDPVYSGGFTWVEYSGLNSNELPGHLSSVQFVDANTGFAVGGSDNAGTVLKTIDGGKSWSIVLNKEYNMLFSVYFTSPDNGYAVGQAGTIIKTVDGGDSWEKIPSGTDSNLNSVFFTGANSGYIVGGNGVILKLQN